MKRLKLRLAHRLQGLCMSTSPHGLWCEEHRDHDGRHVNRMLPGWRFWA